VKKLLGVLFVLAVLAVGGYFGWRSWHTERIRKFAETPVSLAAPRTVDIPPGSGPRRVATLLGEAGVVSNADRFFEFLRLEGIGPKLKAGEYEFEGQVTPRSAAEKIAAGDVKVYRFTVPEGLRVDEILPILAASELNLNLEKLQRLTVDPTFLKKAGVPSNRLEGFLFPETYTFTRGATEESVLTRMIQQALAAYRAADLQRKPGVTLSQLDAFTLASIVEKETGATEERPRISCVFHNRLRVDMPLQTDPTVLYAMSLLRGSWVNNITRRDLETAHPYNTYTTKGLPPGPIANPGAQALAAALNPARCDDLYFVSRNDGTHIFCGDLACHNAAVEKWQREFFRRKRKNGEIAASPHPPSDSRPSPSSESIQK
jgi:UPF0755 protein